MNDLIAKLEAATEGTRELDAEIGLAIREWKVSGRAIGVRQLDGTYRWVAFHQTEEYDHADAIRVIADCLSLRPYTRSIDMALATLVPDTTDLQIGRIWCVKRWARITDGDKEWYGESCTEALALCIAALRSCVGQALGETALLQPGQIAGETLADVNAPKRICREL